MLGSPSVHPQSAVRIETSRNLTIRIRSTSPLVHVPAAVVLVSSQPQPDDLRPRSPLSPQNPNWESPRRHPSTRKFKQAHRQSSPEAPPCEVPVPNRAPLHLRPKI